MAREKKHKFCTVYHPQLQGKVERMNGNIKTKLAKVMTEIKFCWLKALPLVLVAIRLSVKRATGYTSYTLLNQKWQEPR